MLGIASAIVEAIDDYIKLRKINEWAKLIGSFVLSYWISYHFVCGSLLIKGMSNEFSIGSGMVAGATAMGIVYRKSPLTKGMMLAAPQGEALKEMEGNAEVTSK